MIQAKRAGRRNADTGARTSALERGLNHASLLLVGLSGVAYGLMKYLMEPDPDSFSVVNHPLQPAALDLHVLTAPFLVLGIGMLLRDHILARGRNRNYVKSRRTGILLALGVAPMVLSGYLLQTVTNEFGLKALVIVHLVSGGVFMVGYGAHVVVAALARRERARAASLRAALPAE